MLKIFTTVASWLAISLLIFAGYMWWVAKPIADTPYSHFASLVEANSLESIRIEDDQRSVIFQLKGNAELYHTVSPTDLGKLTDIAIKNGVKVTSDPLPKPMGLWVSLLIGILPVIILVFFLYRIAKKNVGSAGDILSFVKN